MKKEKRNKILRRIGRVLLGLLLLFVALVLFIRSPWGQDIIVTRVTEYVSEKTGTRFEIDRLFLTFSGNLSLEGLYLEDKKGDTLVYSKALEADVGLSQILFGNTFNLESLEWDGLKAKVTRPEGSEDFNFTFLVDAFATQDSVPPPEEKVSEPLEIKVGSIDLTDFDIVYEDGFMGIDSKLRLGRMYASANTIDLEAMRFELDDLELSDTEAVYAQTKPFPETEDTTETALPFLAVDNLSIENLKANYNSVPDSLSANVDIADFLLELPKADLAQNDFDIDGLRLQNSKVFLRMPSQESSSDASADSADETAADTSGEEASGQGNAKFEWPAFFVQVANIDFSGNTISYSTGNTVPVEGSFDAGAITVTDMTLRASDISYRPKEVGLVLEKLAFAERSGFQLRDFGFEGEMSQTDANVMGLRMQLNQSSLSGEMAMEYSSVDVLIESPEQASLNLNIAEMQLALEDIFLFQPTLRENEYVKTVANKSINGILKADGTLDNIAISAFRANWGENTSLTANGRIKKAMSPDSLFFDFPNLRATTIRKDILQFVNEDSLGVSMPKNVRIEASAEGFIDDLETKILLKIPEGTAALTAVYKNRRQTAIDAALKVDSLLLGDLLKNEQLGALSLTMDASASGADLNSLNADIKSQVTDFSYNGYDFSGLNLNGDIESGDGDIRLDFKDDNVNLEARSQVRLDSVASDIDLFLNLIGADLQALDLTQRGIKVSTKLNAQLQGNPEDFELDAKVSEGVAVIDDQQYQMDDIDLSVKIDSSNTALDVESGFLTGKLVSNTSPNLLLAVIEKQFRGYFSDINEVAAQGEPQNEAKEDSVKTYTDSLRRGSTDESDMERLRNVDDKKTVRLDMDMHFRPTPILTEVFLIGVERLDSVSVSANFDEATKKLDAELHVPTAAYAGASLDSLNIEVHGTATDLNFDAGLSDLMFDPVHMKKTHFKGNLKNKELLLDFISYDDKEKLVHVASEMRLEKDTIHLHINPEELIFNRKPWSIPQENAVDIGNKRLDFTNFELSRNAQKISLDNAFSGQDKPNIGISFENFKLQTFLSLLNPDEPLASGTVKGKFVVENPFGASGIVADFNIQDLNAMETALGNLSLDASSQSLSSYDFNLALKDGGIDFDLTGDYTVTETEADLNLDMALNKLEMQVIEGLSFGALEETSGNISGKVSVNGTTSSPEYEGALNFNGTEFKVAMLDAIFKVSDERLRLDNSGIYFENFTIQDVNNGDFDIDGLIATEDLANPEFDLNLKAEAFRVLDSKKEDNEMYYGTASLDADMNIGGDMNLPKVEGRLRLRKVTDVTYVVQETQAEVQERDGVVVFVNRENPDAILTRSEEEEPSSFKGYDVNLVLEVANDAVFHIIIDERTGDNLQVSGEAELNLDMNPNGTIGLTGRYETNSGHYETSLYNLVNRKFRIQKGGTITWQGDPMDAKLDVTAIYDVETSAAPLMAEVTSSQDVSTAGKYQQVLPFLVYLNVNGEILEPELSFDLDMPEDAQGSLGGSVYGRVKQLNDQESALNKQVFSLLALNRFYPSSGSDGSGGGTAALARNNVNKVLSGQLNTFSDKILGNSGFELDFDLDSFTDYQGQSGPQDRTQLNINAKKKLFDDRLVVTAGSAVDVEGSAQTDQGQTPIIGNVSLEYLLSEDGRYRLKGFRKSEYQNVIDGQLIITGLALIFNREFNEFSQLFNPFKDNDNLNKKDEPSGETVPEGGELSGEKDKNNVLDDDKGSTGNVKDSKRENPDGEKNY